VLTTLVVVATMNSKNQGCDIDVLVEITILSHRLGGILELHLGCELDDDDDAPIRSRLSLELDGYRRNLWQLPSCEGLSWYSIATPRNIQHTAPRVYIQMIPIGSIRWRLSFGIEDERPKGLAAVER